MTFDYKAFADKARWRTMNDMTGGDYEEHLARVAYEAALKDRDVVLEEAAERAAFVAGYRAAHMVPDAYDSTSAAEEAWEGYRLVSRALKGRV